MWKLGTHHGRKILEQEDSSLQSRTKCGKFWPFKLVLVTPKAIALPLIWRHGYEEHAGAQLGGEHAVI